MTAEFKAVTDQLNSWKIIPADVIEKLDACQKAWFDSGQATNRGNLTIEEFHKYNEVAARKRDVLMDALAMYFDQSVYG